MSRSADCWDEHEYVYCIENPTNNTTPVGYAIEPSGYCTGINVFKKRHILIRSMSCIYRIIKFTFVFLQLHWKKFEKKNQRTKSKTSSKTIRCPFDWISLALRVDRRLCHVYSWQPASSLNGKSTSKILHNFYYIIFDLFLFIYFISLVNSLSFSFRIFINRFTLRLMFLVSSQHKQMFTNFCFAFHINQTEWIWVFCTLTEWPIDAS